MKSPVAVSITVLALLLAGCSQTGNETQSPTSQTTVADVTVTESPVGSAAASPSTEAASSMPAPESSESASQSAEASPTQTSETSATPSESGWVELSVEAKEAADVEKLADTSADFQEFVRTTVTTPASDGCQSQLTIRAWHPSGFAYGEDFAPGCGGGAAIWGQTDGTWGVLQQFQAVMECSEFELTKIPHGVPGLQCTDESGTVVAY